MIKDRINLQGNNLRDLEQGMRLWLRTEKGLEVTIKFSEEQLNQPKTERGDE